MRRSWKATAAATLLSCAAAAASAQTPGASRVEASYYADAFADHYRVPRELVRAIIAQESNWNPKARSTKGAMGLMQLMPDTAARYQVSDPFDVEQNLSGGVQFLSDLMASFHGDLRLVVAGYYCGPKYLLRRGLRYTNGEVYAYVESVQERYKQELAETAMAPEKQFVAEADTGEAEK